MVLLGVDVDVGTCSTGALLSFAGAGVRANHQIPAVKQAIAAAPNNQALGKPALPCGFIFVWMPCQTCSDGASQPEAEGASGRASNDWRNKSSMGFASRCVFILK